MVGFHNKNTNSSNRPHGPVRFRPVPGLKRLDPPYHFADSRQPKLRDPVRKTSGSNRTRHKDSGLLTGCRSEPFVDP